MIATTPVARWTWGRDDEAADGLVLCLHDALAAYAVLASHRFAVGAPKVRLKVPESGNPRNLLFEGELLPGAELPAEETAMRLADEVRAALRPGEIGSVEADITCTGVLLDGEGAEFLQEGLVLLGTASYRDYVTTDLRTFSDAWMPYDLEGRPQTGIHAANHPRLAAALHDLSEALGSETDPDDPTYFGRPTETGVDNFFEPDGSPSDVWSRFEIPRRSEVFRHGPVFDSVGYKRSGAEQVQCVPVVADHGGVLGYLWASDADAAASFEPREAADEEGRKAGLVWLERLHESYERGLTPVQALAACAALPADPVAGHVSENAEPQIIALDALREAAMHGD
ncbi:hypothetical protein [Streptomyces sp. DSM 40750]|uniref:hypothetical protein n=1 Tax=Streptomyces sp. DSM 40750 TaxID=2801030 RepID=UPI00214ABB97|nr:hypothetical protein [Streptomyces sp. DSM 40750]UUU22578.1 hypothetical protein JIX55_21005 [Streptomyces sp. DSM 40750]